MKYFIFVLFVILCITTNSYGETNLFFGVYTHHFNYRSNLNEQNNVIGIKHKKLFYTTFENSNYNRSHFIGYYHHSKLGKIKNVNINWNCYFGALYGYADDYIDLIDGWSIAILPTIEFQYKKIAIEPIILPFDGGVFTIIINLRF